MNVILVLTPGTSTGSPSMTLGLYLYFNADSIDARSDKLLVKKPLLVRGYSFQSLRI